MRQETSSRIVNYEARLFLATCLLSLITWLGGSPDFRVDRQKLIVIPVNFPGNNLAWKKIGERENIQIDSGGITILSHIPGTARVYRDIFIGEQNHFFLQPELILTEAKIRPLNILVDSSMVGKESRFHIQQRSFSDERKFHLFSHASLSNEENGSAGGPISIRSVTRQVEGADTLRVSMVLHAAGAWKLEQLNLYKGQLTKSYLIFLVVVSALWLCLLLRLISIHSKKSVFRSSIMIFLSGTVFVLAIAPIGSVSSVISSFVGDMSAKWSIGGVVLNSKHFLSHFVLTTILLWLSGRSAGVIQSISLLNFGLAISIESWQSHSFFRTSQAQDLVEAVMGTAVALFLCIIFRNDYLRFLR